MDVNKSDDFSFIKRTNNYQGEIMNKTELVKTIATGAGVTIASASKVLDVFMSTVTDTLKRGDQIVLPGFASISTGHRAERTGRNPQTGQTITIPASTVVKFKAGKNLKEAVQDK